MLRYYASLYLFILVIQLPAAAQDSTYRGREFWAGYGHHQFMETGTNTQELVFYLSTLQAPATVTITIDSAATPWTRTYNIPANTVITSDPMPKSGASDARLYSLDPAFGGSWSTGTIRKRGIHIESNVPIAVYSHMYGSSSSGASLMLPVQTWGYTYQSLNSRQQYAANCFSWTYVIAKEDNTSIEISPLVLTRAQDLTGLQPGTSTVIILQKGQIYQVLGANQGADANGNGGTSSDAYELTGTRIRSLSAGNPIAVFSGSSRTRNPGTCVPSGGDNDMVQLFPLHVWGRKYLAAPTAPSGSATAMASNIYKVLVNDPLTVVRKNGVVLTGLLNNSYYLYESNEPALIEADMPIMLAQFNSGQLCNPGSGDPDMYYLSPMDAGVTKVNCVRTTTEAIFVNYVTLIIPTAGISSLLIDGSNIFNHSYVHPSVPGYSVVVKSWTAAIGQFNIQSDSAFTGVSYGMGNVESYGYNIGADFKHNNGADPMVPMLWIGSISSNWFDARNWSTRHIPLLTDHVIIQAGTTFSPAIADGLMAECKSISVETGAAVNVGTNANLNVAGRQ